MNHVKSYHLVLTSFYGQCAWILPIKLIRASIYPMHLTTSNVGTFWKKLILGKTLWTSNEIIVIHHAWYENYYHWTTECLPRLLPCIQRFPKAKILLPSKLSSFHKEQLQLLDIESDRFILIKPDYQLLARKTILLPIDKLVFGKHDFELVKLLSSHLLRTISKPLTTHGKYYLSRKNAPKRKAVNEDEVITFVKSMNFEVILVENLTVIDQFTLFSNAKMVIGVHGSYFVNGISMKPDSHVIDIMEKRHADDCYENLLKPLGIQYHYVLCEGIGNQENYRDNDLLVDCNKLKTLVQSLL